MLTSTLSKSLACQSDHLTGELKLQECLNVHTTLRGLKRSHVAEKSKIN